MAFETWSDPTERKSLQRERQARLESTPIGSYQYVTVVFPTANADREIPLTLKVANEDAANIRFIPVSQDSIGAGIVYRDASASAKPWSPTRIYLRFSTVGTVRMLVFTEA